MLEKLIKINTPPRKGWHNPSPHGGRLTVHGFFHNHGRSQMKNYESNTQL